MAWRKQLRPRVFVGLSFVVISLFAVGTGAIGCVPRPMQTMTLKDTEYADTGMVNGTDLGGQQCDQWEIRMEELLDKGCDQPNSYLLLEFWRQDRVGNTYQIAPRELVEDIYFLVSNTIPPQVTVSGGQAYLTPQRGDGLSGTNVDVIADAYHRPYHRIVIAMDNVTVLRNWYITVGNLNPSNSNVNVDRYLIRGQCLAGIDLPCPQPLPDKGECSDAGQCVMSTQDSDPTEQYCQCKDGYGDYGCNEAIQRLTSSGTPKYFTLQPSRWQYFYVKVPPRSSMLSELVVELLRTPSANFQGDPILLVKPVSTEDRNVPWYTDINTYGDLKSYFLQQNFHYFLTRDLVDDRAYYIGVYNNGARFQPVPANLTVTVSWMTNSPSEFRCPNNCYNRGTCRDPLQSASSQPVALGVQSWQPSMQSFMCVCKPGYGGTLCEGNLQQLVLGGKGDPYVQSSFPGQWDFYVINIDSAFDYRYDDIALEWNIPEGNGKGMSYVQAFMTIDENSYPRQADYSSDDPFRRGWQIFYSRLAERADPPLPLQIKGSDLKTGYVYVVGIYNSDYLKVQPFRYELNIYIPSTGSSWLHPYMSVVLGVTASVILCLFMTLCKRFIQRHGFGPWRPRPSANRAVIQIVPGRSPGVPQEIINAFATFEYKLDDVERQKRAQAAARAERAAAEGAGAEPTEDETPQCAVCLGEYEDAEIIRRLPCVHEFHQSCIDKWMQTHTTCPICRISLVPEDADTHEAHGHGPVNLAAVVVSGNEGQQPQPSPRRFLDLFSRSNNNPAAASPSAPPAGAGTIASSMSTRQVTESSASSAESVSDPVVPAPTASLRPGPVATLGQQGSSSGSSSSNLGAPRTPPSIRSASTRPASSNQHAVELSNLHSPGRVPTIASMAGHQ